MSFPRYPEYKDSGVEWLGEVPAHWVVGPLRWYATIQGGVAKGKSYSDDTPTVDLPYLRVANVQDGHVDLSSVNTVTVALSEVDRYRLQTGDVLMNEGGDNDKLGRGTVWEGEIADCLHQNHVFAIRPNPHLLPHWLSMFTRSITARAYFYLYSKQSTNLASISSSNVMSCPLPLPPVSEQRRILDFLDHETSRIDALVEEQQRLIELLKEKRQAVISHAVTKGLDPDVPMKDSGVEWLGEVPAHWSAVRIRHACLKVTDGAHISPETENGEYPFVSTRDISGGKIDFQNCLLTSRDSYQYLVKTGCQPLVGDVLFSKDGTIGETAVVQQGEKFVVASSLIILRARKSFVLPEFLELLLQSSSSLEQAECFVKGAALRRLSIQNVLKIWLVVPQIDEQKQIIEMLNESLSSIEKLKINSEKLMALLRERRSALISAAVTGKIDFRGWQPPVDSSAVIKASQTEAV